ncbi:anti-sigma factor family protein [Oryzobacter sp. R7]|uniref:anti-sigma factor family protein n=1 Tax=Oryzobacter faecalis TaxID=3388656 RepID=UPI00398D1FA7
MSLTPRVRCLGGELSEYVAGRLPAERQWEWDRHLVACRVCAHAVESERRIRAAFADGPTMPGDLRVTLLALGSSLAADTPTRPAAAAPRPLALLAPSAPPCHRSPLRATVVAAAAAGVSAAAAWSLTVLGTPAPVRPGLTTTSTPAVQPAAPTTAFVTAGLEVRGGPARPATATVATQRAQSAP